MSVIDAIRRRRQQQEWRYTTLLVSLIVLFAVYPLMHQLGWSRYWSLFLVAELLLAVDSISSNRKTLTIALALVTPAILGELAFFFLETKETHWFSALSVGLFLAYVIFVVYKASVFGGGEITRDRVSGAIAVYLLAGLLWALVYGVLAAADPGAIKGIDPFELGQPGAQQDYIYFSFVTLTTLGYGDFSPVSPWAQTLAWLEAVFGQLFLAVTIARLVSLEIAHSAQQKSAD